MACVVEPSRPRDPVSPSSRTDKEVESAKGDHEEEEASALPQVVATNSQRFDVADSAGYMAHLDLHGYCVIASVANEGQVDRAKVGMPDTHQLAHESLTTKNPCLQITLAQQVLSLHFALS